MWENLLLITLIIFVLWVAGMALYLYSSREQQALQEELEQLRRMLGDDQNAV